MASTKLEISGKEINDAGDPPQSSYKPIPEADSEDIPLTRPKSLVTSKGSTPEVDGADEKMLPKDEQKVSPNSNVNTGDVKFVGKDKQNGDAKLDIGEVKSQFVGMGKEELMKYANDPFWVRLRWCLFIGFWLLWAGMLVGAILIIVAAPKCSPPEPRTWWEEGPLTEIPPSTSPESLHEIKNNGIQGVIVSYTDSDVYKALSNISLDFLNFLKAAKDENLPVIVDLNPLTSRIWFEKSEAKEVEFNDYYVWQAKKNTLNDGRPNNWLRPDNQPAWNLSSTRNEYYLSFNQEPQLNFRNPKVVDEFSDVLKKFLDEGVSGVRLQHGSFLLVDDKFEDEGLAPRTNAYADQYGFYTHTKTRDVAGLGNVLKIWRDIVKNKTENGLLFISDELTNLQNYKSDNNLLGIDLPKHSSVFSSGKNLNASLLKRNLESAFEYLEDNWPLWERRKNNLADDVQDLITFLLRGTTLINPEYKVNKDLLKLRKTSPSIMYGNSTLYECANNTIFAFVRVAAGNPGYLVAVNPTPERINVNFLKEVPIVSDEVTVQFTSANYSEPGIETKLKASASNITISPHSAIVLTYVPKSE